MGCDIHTHIECRRNWVQNPTWIDADHYKRNEYFGLDECEKEFDVIEVFGNRNYSLFSLLADVRNYGNTVPISEPRGLPEDCNEHIVKDFEDWGCDAHSESYFTLKELIDFQSTNPVQKYSGYISPQSAKQLDEDGILPREWCQGTTDRTWIKRTWSEKSEELLPLIDALKERGREFFHCSEADVSKYADDIRFVFWFDN